MNWVQGSQINPNHRKRANVGFEGTFPFSVLLCVDPMNDDLSANLEQERIRGLESAADNAITVRLLIPWVRKV